MEINDLKSVWKKANDQEKPGYWVSEEDVQKMIRNKSRLTIGKIKKALKLKILLLSVMTLLMPLTTWYYKSGALDDSDFMFDRWLTSGQIGSMMIFMSAIILVVLIMSIQRYRKISSLMHSSLPLSEALSEIRAIIKGVINTGIYGDVIGAPIVVIWGMSINYYGEEGFLFDIRLLYVIFTATILPILVYYKNSRFMTRRYGHFIEAIDESLSELEATNSEKNTEEV